MAGDSEEVIAASMAQLDSSSVFCSCVFLYIVGHGMLSFRMSDRASEGLKSRPTNLSR